MFQIVRKRYLESAQKFFSRRKKLSWSVGFFGKIFGKKCHFSTLPFFARKKSPKKFGAAQKIQREGCGSSPISILKAGARAFPVRERIERARGRTRCESGREIFFFKIFQKCKKKWKKFVLSAHGVNRFKNGMPLLNSKRYALLRSKKHYGVSHFEQFHAVLGPPKWKFLRKKAKNGVQKHPQNRPKNFPTMVSCQKPNEKWWLFFLTSMIRPGLHTPKNFIKNGFAVLSNAIFDPVLGQNGSWTHPPRTWKGSWKGYALNGCDFFDLPQPSNDFV